MSNPIVCSSFGRALRANSALAGFAATVLVFAGSPAFADCDMFNPGVGATVNCTGVMSGAVNSGGANVTVNFNNASRTNIAVVVASRANNTLNFTGTNSFSGSNIIMQIEGANGTNTTMGSGTTLTSTDHTIYMFNDDNNTITLNSATVNSTGTNRFGIYANQGSGNIFTLNGTASMSADSSSSAIFIDSNEDNATINLNGQSSVSGGIGITSQNGVGTTVNVNGTGSGVNVAGSVGLAIALDDGDDTVDLAGISTFDGGIRGRNGTDALFFDNATVSMTNGSITGFESVTLTGDSTLSGSIDSTGQSVALGGSGSLHINSGSFIANNLTIGSGTTYGGNNTVMGSLTVGTGGTLAPGNSVGTINVTGNVNFATGSTFQVEVDSGGVDRLNASGSINIDPGATLELLPLGTFAGSTATFLDAGTTLTGTFDTVITNGIAATVVYTADDGLLNFSVLTASPAVANAQAISSYNSAALFSDAVRDFASQNAFSRKNHYWFQGLYRGINHENNGVYTGFDDNIYGAVGGAEYAVADNYRFGFSLSDLSNDTRLDSSIGRNDGNGAFASAYGTYTKGAIFSTLGVTGGYYDYDSSRRVSNSGVVSQAKSQNNAYEAGALAQVGMRQNIAGSDWQVTPSLGLEYIHIFADGYTEKSGGAAAVSIDDYDFGTLRTSADIEFANRKGYPIAGVQAMPRASIGIARDNTLSDRDITGRFSTGTPFGIDLDNSDKTYATVGAGFDVAVRPGVTAFVDYQGASNGSENRNDARIGAKLEF